MRFALPDEPALLWTYESGGSAFEATPVIGGGLVFLGDAEGTMHAVRLADGEPVWTHELNETFLLSAAAVFAPQGVRGKSVASEVLVADADGVLHLLNGKDGKERWAFDTESEVYGGPTFVGLNEEGWLVLVGAESGQLYGIDLVSGEQRWLFEIDAPLRCAATIVNGHALLAGCDGNLHTVDVATGKETGSVSIGGPTGNTAAVRDGVAYFGTEQGEFYAIDVTDPANPTVVWTRRDAKRGQGIRTAAALAADTVVYANQAKSVFALSTTDGAPLWEARTRSRVEASPLALAGGRTLVATSRGRLLLLDTSSGDEVWWYDAGGSFIASPAGSDGRVLVANTDGTLSCWGAKSNE